MNDTMFLIPVVGFVLMILLASLTRDREAEMPIQVVYVPARESNDTSLGCLLLLAFLFGALFIVMLVGNGIV